MHLSKSEYEIMQLIWAREGWVTSQDICQLSQSRGWKGPTVSTFLARLCDKGLLETQKQGKLRFYRPLMSAAEYARGETRALIDTLYGGQPSLLIAGLAGGGLTEADREALKRLLEEPWT